MLLDREQVALLRKLEEGWMLGVSKSTGRGVLISEAEDEQIIDTKMYEILLKKGFVGPLGEMEWLGLTAKGRQLLRSAQKPFN